MKISCPVQKAIERLLTIKENSFSEGTPLPSELDLLIKSYQDITEGKGQIESIDSIKDYLEVLISTNNPGLSQLASELLNELSLKHNIITAHILNHYCLSGECLSLSAPPCQIACPAYVDIPSYVTLVGMGKYQEALEVLWEDIPFPGTLGRVCIHPCEDACRRGKIDEPISICKLKRVAYDYGINESSGPKKIEDRAYPNKIAIIGSGPAGLSAGYFLRRMGYEVTIFEKLPVPGGMMAVGIPEYRLPRDILQKEIGIIQKMGVEIKTGITFGKDISIEQLKEEGYKAFFIATGLHRSRRLNIEGEDLPGVLKGVDFLRDIALKREVSVGDRVVVIGGGNVAIDVARSSKRVGAKDVTMVCLEQRDEMPAWEYEIQEALEEGVSIVNGYGPRRFIEEGGRLKGVEFKKCTRVFDEDGRFNPSYDESQLKEIKADTTVVAIGQAGETESLEGQGIPLNKNGTIKADPVTLQTEVPEIFAGGDMVTGPRTVVEAVGAGKRVALSIHRYLQGIPINEEPIIPMRRKLVPPIAVNAEERARKSRPSLSYLPVDKRSQSFQEVEQCYPKESAEIEAKRCLRCDICMACGICVETCRDIDVNAIKLSYIENNPSEETDFVKINENCIGCGSCKNNCPTGAITTQQDEENILFRMCGVEMSRHKMIRCKECGKLFITEKHLKYIQEKTKENPKLKSPANICPECSRKLYSETALKIIPGNW